MPRRIWERIATSALCAAVGWAAISWVDAAEAPPSSPQPVDRVVLHWKPDTMRVVSRIPLVKILPPTEALPPGGVASGFWIELRSADEQVRYRRILTDPTRLVHEGPIDAGGGETKTHRVEGAALERTFSVLVPRANPGDQLLLFGTPPGAKKRATAGASVAIARLALDPPPAGAKPLDKGGEK